MMNTGSVLVGVVATTAWWFGWIWPLLYVVVALLTAYYTILWSLVRGKMYDPPPPKPQVTITSVILQKMMEKEGAGGQKPQLSRKTIISRSLDNALQEVIELVCRDFILNWYQEISSDQTTLINSVQSEMWQLVDNFSSRLSNIDVVTVATQDVVATLYEHFKHIRLAQKREGDPGEGGQGPFLLHSWLRDEEREEECLRQVTEALLLILLPPAYARCDSHRHLLREIISTSVFQVTIDMLCDPDYINQKILAYIKQQEKLMADTKRTYTYAASYEDFVKMINISASLDELKQMRFKIISEIMQATTINNLKKAQGINTDKESSPRSLAKGELLKARNLKRYINQLTVAKQLVEKRMQGLSGGGGAAQSPTTGPSTDADGVTLPGQKVLSFAVIMETPKAREYFMRFLEEDGNDFMLGFCIDVETLRACSKDQQHQVGTEIYQQYVSKSARPLPIEKTTIKGMETFLRGDGGPEAFYEADRQIREELENEHYHSFFVSDLYHQYISTLEKKKKEKLEEEEEEDDNLDNLSIVSNELFLDDKGEEVEEEDKELLADQSYHARQLLRQLDTKMTNKTQAMQALQSSQKLEKEKVKKLYEDLEHEVEKMRNEQKELEAHIERTKLWTENIGHWKVGIVNATVEVEEERKVPQFVLLVSLNNGEAAGGGDGGKKEASPVTIPTTTVTSATHKARGSSSQGWAVQRTLDDFYALHEKLTQIGPWLQKKDLPSQSRGPFRSMDAAYLEKAKATLSDYLMAVMQDEKMIHSETLYAFFAPSPQFLHQPSTQRRNKFSVSMFKRSLPSLKQEAEDDDFLFFSEDSSKDDRTHDSIAKPLYALLGEVFELRGMFKWVRRSFMTFVELTFGGNINRQLREMVKWTYSEQMLLFYIRTFNEAMWPGGKLAESPPTKTDAQKFETRMAAKNKLLKNIPDALKTLVGEDNARRGTIKVFEVLQNKTLNKHLIYNLLEIFVLELCPELKKTRQSLLESLQHQAAQAVA
ncbi:sorting nexin-25-like [Littorina saxatilis]|uniref:Sorting nexin-25 n=1 Tax=Littorina saxatilis TaxID=31220 RepID=A0AAN9G8D0_9CAEN